MCITLCLHCNTCKRGLFVSILNFLRLAQIKKNMFSEKKEEHDNTRSTVYFQLGEKKIPKNNNKKLQATSSCSFLYFWSVPLAKAITVHGNKVRFDVWLNSYILPILSLCFVASRHQSRRSPTFYSLKLLKTKKQTNKQPKISQTEWCIKISELQNPSLRGIPLGGPRDMASNNLQLFYLFLFLFYCCDSSVSVCTFYMWWIFFFFYLLSTCLPVKRVHFSWPFHLSACDCSTLSMWVGGGGITSFTWGG